MCLSFDLNLNQNVEQLIDDLNEIHSCRENALTAGLIMRRLRKQKNSLITYKTP